MSYPVFGPTRGPTQVFKDRNPCTFTLTQSSSEDLIWLIHNMGGQVVPRINALYCLCLLDDDGEIVPPIHPKAAYHASVRFLDQRFVTDCFLARRWLDIDLYDVNPWPPVLPRVIELQRKHEQRIQLQLQEHLEHQPQHADNDSSDTDDDDALPLKSGPSKPVRDHPVTTNDTVKNTTSSKRPRDDKHESDHPSTSRQRV